MVCPVNKLIVTIDKKFNDEITLSSGIKLYQDTSFHPEQHVTTTGKVVAVPLSLNDRTENKGAILEVQVGDEVSFDYTIVFDVDDSGNHKNMIWHEGEEYWFVEHSQVFCVKRGDQVIPIGSNVIIDQIEQPAEEKFAGSIFFKPESSQQTIAKGTGILRHIGTPLTHEPVLDVCPGDVVYFKPEIAAVYELYGKKQIIIRQRDLLAKLKKVV